jgi:hypothetical protein
MKEKFEKTLFLSFKVLTKRIELYIELIFNRRNSNRREL